MIIKSKIFLLLLSSIIQTSTFTTNKIKHAFSHSCCYSLATFNKSLAITIMFRQVIFLIWDRTQYDFDSILKCVQLKNKVNYFDKLKYVSAVLKNKSCNKKTLQHQKNSLNLNVNITSLHTYDAI